MKSSSKLKILISFVIISTCIQYSLTQDYPGVDDYPGDYSEGGYRRYTANVYRDREIRVRGFQIYVDCQLPKIPVILKFPHSHFHCNICGEFDFTGILWGYPTLVVGKSCINYGETM